MFGLWSGMFIGLITEYYTSNAYTPTLKLYRSCRSGAATNIIRGLSLGYESCIIPIIFITATIAYSFTVAGMYGIGLSALGMLGALPVALTIDGYGPISDNAGGIAEMCECPSSIRDRTDALDAAGNTTAAVGKGFAIGSACLVGLALFGAFVTRIQATTVNILQPIQFSGLLIGAMLPYAFSSMTMVAVGDAAEDMMDTIIAEMSKVDKLRNENPEKNPKDFKPDYAKCIKVSTDASLYYMIAPGLMVILVPIVGGILFGSEAVEGILAGSIVSGVQVAISASNTGGAWDNAKKETEKRRSEFYDYCVKESEWEEFRNSSDKKALVRKLMSEWAPLKDDEKEKVETNENIRKLKDLVCAFKEQHTAAVVGDTVGDPLKDTSGPAINILIKLGAITSLVFGSYINNAGYLVRDYSKKNENNPAV
jgi:inorganic pyrophosphatase